MQWQNEKEDTVGYLLRQMRQFPVLSRAEQVKLGQEMLQPGRIGKQARDRMVLHNMRLVTRLARKYSRAISEQPGALAFEDFIAIGHYGLIEAASRFDVTLGYTFSTYAYWWIRQAMVRAIEDSHRTIRIPTHVCERYERIKKEIHTHTASTGVLPSLEKLEFAAYKGKPAKGDRASVQEIMQAFKPVWSLDRALVEGEESAPFVDSIVVSVNSTAEAEIEQSQSREGLEDLMDRVLSDRERDVIYLRFGWHGDKPLSLDAIGNRYGITRERIRQIEIKALRKLRNAANYFSFHGEERAA